VVQHKQELSSITLVYPKYPFDWAFYEVISGLPDGFQKLALRERLSMQFILVLDEAMGIIRRTQGFGAQIAMGGCIDRVATAGDLTQMERLLAHTLHAYCFHSERSSAPEAVLQLQANLGSLSPDRGTYVLGEPEEDALDWAACIICATTEKGSDAWKWADRILRCTNGTRLTLMSENRRTLLEKTFFEIPRARIVEI